MANKTLTILKYTSLTIGAVLAFDAVCFMAWAMSGQQPVDNFYFGSITSHAIQALFF